MLYGTIYTNWNPFLFTVGHQHSHFEDHDHQSHAHDLMDHAHDHMDHAHDHEHEHR